MINSFIKRGTSWKYLVEAYQVCTQKYAKLLFNFGLTPSQLDVLIQIELLGDQARPKLIAEGLLVTKGNITSVTKRLIERNIISQQSDTEDLRSAVFRITPQGDNVLQNAKKAAKAFIDAQLAPFSDEEVQLVGELMKKMRRHLESKGFDDALVNIQSSAAAKE